jgi:hypothetical protein
MIDRGALESCAGVIKTDVETAWRLRVSSPHGTIPRVIHASPLNGCFWGVQGRRLPLRPAGAAADMSVPSNNTTLTQEVWAKVRDYLAPVSASTAKEL